MALLSRARARRRRGAAGGGDLCRALRPPRLQRPVRRPARGSEVVTGRPRVALIACGAIAQPAAEIVDAARLAGRRAPAAAAAAQPAAADRRRGRAAGASSCAASYDEVAVGYADCGTYGALDDGLRRARAAPAARAALLRPVRGRVRLAAFLDEQPGTYLLTDFLVRSFARTVVAGARAGPVPRAARRLLPPLHARRCGWPRSRTTSCARWPRRPPPRIGLPLTVVETGDAGSRPRSRRWSDQRAAGEQLCRQASVSAIWLNVKTCRPSTSMPGVDERRRALLEEPLAGEATGCGEAGEGALVLGQEAGRLADADLGGHGQQLGAVDRAGDARAAAGMVTPRGAHPPHPGRAAAAGSNVRLLTTWVA